MRTLIIFIFGIIISVGTLSAQAKVKPGSTKAKNHKIVFQMVSKDTTDHSALMRQLGNILKLAPGTKLEVVCHGPGLSILIKDKSIVQDKLTSLAAQKVDFVACEFTMSQKNISRDQLVDICRTVPGGILEIVDKQDKGWSYIKSGY